MLKLILAFTLTLSLSAKEVGEIIFVKGVVKIKQGDKQLQATKGQRFINKSIIETGSNALAVLSLVDGSKVKLNKSSKIVVSVSKNSPTRVGIFKGSSFFNVLKKKMLSKDKFIVKTKNASFGVRGTEFFISYGKGGAEDTWMCVNEGLVRVSPKDSKESVDVKAGEGVQVKDKKSVSTPKPLAWTSKLNWNLDSSKGQLENKVNIEDAYTDLLDQDYD